MAESLAGQLRRLHEEATVPHRMSQEIYDRRSRTRALAIDLFPALADLVEAVEDDGCGKCGGTGFFATSEHDPEVIPCNEPPCMALAALRAALEVKS